MRRVHVVRRLGSTVSNQALSCCETTLGLRCSAQRAQNVTACGPKKPRRSRICVFNPLWRTWSIAGNIRNTDQKQVERLAGDARAGVLPIDHRTTGASIKRSIHGRSVTVRIIGARTQGTIGANVTIVSETFQSGRSGNPPTRKMASSDASQGPVDYEPIISSGAASDCYRIRHSAPLEEGDNETVVGHAIIGSDTSHEPRN